ncbi:hypothetical protein [Psychrobacter piscatorii]|uniref:hypothetical protein n=1 Tax=Psychrobacter piscatorii TaxID=554343 RepID=UPI003736F02D
MSENISVRSLLVDRSTGKFIKSIDERGLCDFLELMTKHEVEKNEVILFDFAPVVEYVHNELESKLAQKEDRNLAIKRATIFNTWMRLKTVTDEMFLCQISSQVIKDSEEVLNWIYSRIPDLEKEYNQANDNNEQNHYKKNEKTEALLKLSIDIEVFIEVLLCNIYATAKVDIKSLKFDSVLTGHCNAIHKLVLEALCSEAGFNNKSFTRDSLIYQVCMENLGINSEALLHLLGSSDTTVDIKNYIHSNAVTENEWDDWSRYYQRKYTINWPISDPNAIDRVKILSKLLEKIKSLLILIDELKKSEVYFEGIPEKQSEFECNIQKLLSNPDT